tara:strand:+ start:9706 stop:9876 length:171 start_codon:yes stop_codon:yes gene_type:complete
MGYLEKVDIIARKVLGMEIIYLDSVRLHIQTFFGKEFIFDEELMTIIFKRVSEIKT